ncbi:MAG: orotidine-5'-phosphate decarboxylase [Oscillospiraceae bacterium]|jgi:orotidine-5'-phosphate decarboxylase|nr:orotidine-5'-phosphate decarboxylase [Oscillospiraceae bacterium]
MSFDTLIEKIDRRNNPSVIGLDPDTAHIPRHLLDAAIAKRGETLDALAAAAEAFCTGIIDAVCDIVPAVKPQTAFFERLGAPGTATLARVAQYASERGLYVIADAKRGDIGTTAAAYADGFLGSVKVGKQEIFPFRFDSLTVSGYLGSDGLVPFYDAAKKHKKSVFVLVKTSNPSSGELQDLVSDGTKIYERMGALLESLSAKNSGKYGYSPLGAVVGATYPRELYALRRGLPHTFFLIPGYGAQGGGAADVVPAFDKDGRGAIVNSSRGIIAAWKKTGNDGTDFAEAARRAALEMRDDLARARCV